MLAQLQPVMLLMISPTKMGLYHLLPLTTLKCISKPIFTMLLIFPTLVDFWTVDTYFQPLKLLQKVATSAQYHHLEVPKMVNNWCYYQVLWMKLRYLG